MKKIHIALLPRIIIAIILGVILGHIFPLPLIRVFATFNAIFGNLLKFLIPLIIFGLVTPAIGDIGKGAGRLLLITALIAYFSTVSSGFISYFTSASVFPGLIELGAGQKVAEIGESVEAYFNIQIPPVFDVMSALVLSFTIGLGITALKNSTALKDVMNDFKAIITKTIENVIIPLLPLYIMGIFMTMTYSGQAARVIDVFLKIIIVIFIMHICLLLLQFVIAGLIAKKNPFRMLKNMLPAYFTALGTSSSAATIPVTLRQVKINGVNEGVAGFVVPLCATIHMSGSMLKIVACAVALMLMQDKPFDIGMFAGFILMLGVMMVASPGVPGGSIMAALGVLSSMLGFDEADQALMIALYIAMDNFGTACNVTGDGAIALIVNRIHKEETTSDL
ncbi:MAG: dicarboxylate/amino acid:cation symporter [Bacteroidaceae bacterium]|nr:dicarboxylate/amino acid:cation symporter [Bacteroidaceae bacterium]